MSISVTPIPRLVELTTPNFSLGTSNVAGAALTSVASNSTLLAFDGTTPAAVAGAGAVGSATVAARRDHVHSSVSGAITTVDNDIARYTGTSGALQGYTSGGPTISDTGVMVQTAQPAVTVYENGTVNNITGAGTLADLSFNTEVFDQAGNYSDPTFTAPVDGRYLFIMNTVMSGITTAMTRAAVWCVTSNRNWISGGFSPTAVDDVNNSVGFHYSGIADLDASDTLKMQIVIYNGSGDTADQEGGSSLLSTLSICLLV